MQGSRFMQVQPPSAAQGEAYPDHAFLAGSQSFFCLSCTCMRSRLRFLWNATKGHRIAPWRSPYLLWRIETYTGVKMKEIGFLEFWAFMWRERRELWRFLRWTGEMERWVQPRPKNS